MTQSSMLINTQIIIFSFPKLVDLIVDQLWFAECIAETPLFPINYSSPVDSQLAMPTGL